MKIGRKDKKNKKDFFVTASCSVSLVEEEKGRKYIKTTTETISYFSLDLTWNGRENMVEWQCGETIS